MISGKKIVLILLSGFLILPLSAQVNLTKDSTASKEESYKFLFAEGLRLKNRGQANQAMALFQQCIELKPESPAPFYELGLQFLQEKEYATAEGYARNAWKRDNRNEWYGILLCEALMAQGKFEPCAEVFAELQKSYPDKLEFVTGEIEVLQQAGMQKEALKRLSRTGRHPSLDRWKALKEFEIQLALGKRDKGAAVLEKWLKKYPSDVKVRGHLAESYVAAGKKDQALKHYQWLVKENPDNPAVNFSYGNFLLKQENKEKARASFLKGFRSTEVNPAIKIAIITEFLKAGQEEEPDPAVIEMIKVVYETDQGNPEVDAMYANYLYTIEKLDEAEPIYRRITRSDPGNYLAWQNLLFILNEREKIEEIAAVADSALIFFPMQSLFHLFKGIGAIGLKDYETAKKALKKGMAIPGQAPEITQQFYLSLSEAAYRTGDKEEAYRNFDQLLALDPDNSIVLNNYSYYLSLDGEQLDKALDMIKRCVEHEKDNPTYLDTYAWVLFKRGEYSKALEVMEKVMSLTIDHSGEVLEHYGDILFKNGHEDKAVEMWKQASKQDDVSDSIDDKIINGLK